MMNRSNLQSQHPPTPHHAINEDHHRVTDHPKSDLTPASPHTPSVDRDRKLKRHDEHHPN